MNKTIKTTAVAALATVAVATPAVASTVVYHQTFEKGYDSVLDAENGGWAGDIQKVRSEKDGNVASATGKFHAIAAEGPYPGYPDITTGPFTRFGGYSTEFGGGFTTSVDVYLDPALAEGEGFEWSAAASKQNGDHLRDFIFHVKKIDGRIMVGASNGSGWQSDSLVMPANGEVFEPGWVTLTQEFKNVEGALVVDMLVNGKSIDKLTNPADVIDTVVGGNRYGWFTMIETDSVAVDNITLTRS